MKRTPIARRTPLRQTAARRAPSTPIPAATRAMLHVRAGGRCELCGITLAGEPGHAHHRRGKGMGGSSLPDRDAIWNLVLLHTLCHAFAHGRGLREAVSEGWIVPRHTDPRLVPVGLYGCSRVLLGAAGEYLAMREAS